MEMEVEIFRRRICRDGERIAATVVDTHTLWPLSLLSILRLRTDLGIRSSVCYVYIFNRASAVLLLPKDGSEKRIPESGVLKGLEVESESSRLVNLSSSLW